MKTTFMAAFVLAAALLAPASAIEISEQRIVSRDQIQRALLVRDVTMGEDGEVSGIVVNRSSNPVSDVRLAVRYDWLWRNEMKPGHDDLTRAEFYTLPGEIPPGGSMRFTFRPGRPLERRSDGRYMAAAEPVEFLEVVAGGTPPGTTSGTEGTPGTAAPETDTGAAPGPPASGTYEPAEPSAVPPRTRTPEVPY
jgi:hypothetical protein